MAETATDALGGVGIELLGPLERAAGKGDAQETATLLASGATVSIDESAATSRPLRRTVLHWASFGGNPDVLRAVFQVVIEDAASIAMGHSDLSDALAVTCLSTLGGPNGTTALHLAVEGGHVEAVVVLLEAGANDSVRDGNNRTPMSLAVAGGRNDIVLELLRRGRARVDTLLFADENAAFEHGPLHGTLLHWASFGGYPGMVKAVLEAIKSNDASDSDEVEPWQPLVFDAVGRRCWRVLGGPDETTLVQTTALHLATELGHVEAVADLLKAWANPVTRDWRRCSAVEDAVSDNNVEILSLFLEAGVDPNHCRPLSAPLRDLSSDATFLEEASLLYGRTKFGGESLLHVAAQQLSDGAAELLLAAGAREDTPAFLEGNPSLQSLVLPVDVVGIGVFSWPPEMDRRAKAIKAMLARAHLYRKGWLSVLRARFDAGESLTGRDGEGKGSDDTGGPTPRQKKGGAAAGAAGAGKRNDVDLAAAEDEAWFRAAVWVASVSEPGVFRIITSFV